MKKTVLALTLVMTLVLALGLTSVVSAQSSDPTPDPARCGWLDKLFNRDNCVMGRPDGAAIGGGILHEYMESAFADKLGISVEDLEERLTSGETMAQIAVAEGLDLEDFQAWIQDARTEAIDQAVADGVITSEQAEWMESRGGMMFGGNSGYGRSGGMMFGGFGRSGRSGGSGNQQSCPMFQ